MLGKKPIISCVEDDDGVELSLVGARAREPARTSSLKSWPRLNRASSPPNLGLCEQRQIDTATPALTPGTQSVRRLPRIICKYTSLTPQQQSSISPTYNMADAAAPASTPAAGGARGGFGARGDRGGDRGRGRGRGRGRRGGKTEVRIQLK